ncbi:zinc finger protein 467-like [Varroa jacobsoni]|uniref:C2H2-type domain-containing protein n=1 Tax=Varroa destructor TaxID=109461 RepID=A0A7M7M951_VARDE|nr:zinc finger protein 467-like [Varroa destructor]XP_022703252.1 zinc finger protein 467-like [Varroa jacobsoni]
MLLNTDVNDNDNNNQITPCEAAGQQLHRPHECPLCHKGFTRSNHLADHVRRHTGERPYPCSYCQKKFATKSHRREHERTHVGGKLECHLCPSRFTRRRQALQHLRGHGIDTALLETNINIWPMRMNGTIPTDQLSPESPPTPEPEQPSTTSCV